MTVEDEEFEKVDYSNSNHADSALVGSSFKSCNFSATKLNGSRLVDCTFTDCSFIGTEFGETTLLDCRFLRCKFDTSSFILSEQTRTIFEECLLREIDMQQSSLHGLSFPKSELQSLNMHNLEHFKELDFSEAAELGVLQGMSKLTASKVSMEQMPALGLLLSEELGLSIENHI